MEWKETRTNFTRNLAVVIGIDNYENERIRDLSTPVNDASAIADLLETDYAYKQDTLQTKVIRLFDKQATLTGIRDMLTKTLPQLDLTEGDRLIFYFAGHGLPRTNEDGPEGYLVPQDADPGKPDSFLPMREVSEELSKLACHHLLVILDCCFAGTFRWVGSRDMIPVLKTIHREHYYRFIRYPAWQLITSAAHDQEALDVAKLNQDKRGEVLGYDDRPHSPFALALLEGLQHNKDLQRQNADLIPDGVVTAHELFIYLEQRVSKLSKERQTPGLYPLRRDYDKGEFIFTPPKFDPEKQLEPAPSLNEENNPYRGLKPFDEKHAEFFFGRQVLVEALIKRLCQPEQTLQVVLGVSGSGKSSLVKAGLLPRLRVDKSPWYILEPMRPQASPFMALARVLLPVVNPTLIEQLAQVSFLDEKLKQVVNQPDQKTDSPNQATGSTAATTDPLKKAAANWGSAQPEAKLLLIEDYFAQLEALCSSEELRSLTALHQALLSEIDATVKQLQHNQHYLSQEIQKWSQAHPNTTLLLVIDQFEELITMSQNSAAENRGTAQTESNGTSDLKQLPFLETLREAIATCPQQWRVVVTLRSDFEPRFLDSPLQAYWQAARFPVRAMNSDELRQAIEGPALKQALYFEPDNLVGMLIDEVGQMPGALPLLSFTLSELYVKLHERWTNNPESTDRALRIEDYEDLGGVAGALTRRATAEYESQELNDLERATMRRVMLRMVTIEGSGVARRQVPESELVYPSVEENQRREKVINQLVNVRLLVKGQETGRTYVEPAHDFLLRWNKLQTWIEQEKEDLALQQRLTPAANDWNKNDREQEYLWIRDPRLALLEKVLESETENWLNQFEREFVETSKRKRLDELEETKQQLEISEERRLAAELELASVTTLRRFENERGIVALIYAMKVCQDLLEWTEGRNPRLEIYPTVSPLFTLQTILDDIYEQDYFFYSAERESFWNWMSGDTLPEIVTPEFDTGHGESNLRRSSDGGHFVTVEKSETAIAKSRWRVWKAPREPITEVLNSEIQIYEAQFSPDGTVIAIKGYRSDNHLNTVKFHDLEGNLLGEFNASIIQQVEFNFDASKIIVIERLDGGEGTQRLHYLANLILDANSRRSSQSSRILYIGEVSHHRYYGSARFAPDGYSLITGDRTVIDVRPVRVCNLRPHLDLKVADSTDVEKQLTTSQTYLEVLWKDGLAQCIEQDTVIATLEGPEIWFDTVILSPQRHYIASIASSEDAGIIRIWTAAGQNLTQFGGLRGVYSRIVFSPQDNYCAVIENKNLGVSIISVTQNFQLTAKLQGNDNQFSSLNFSPDEQRIATVGLERTIRLWDLRARQLAQLDINNPEISLLPGYRLDMGDGFDPHVGFTEDGQWVVFRGRGRRSSSALLWKVESLQDLLRRGEQWSAENWQDQIDLKIDRLLGSALT
jgi:WD40 repeat protein